MRPPGYYKPLTLEVRNNREDTLSVFLTTYICVYITLILLLLDLSTLPAISHFNQFYIYILYTYIYVYFIYIHILYTYIYIYIYILQEYLLWKYLVCKLMTWRKCTSAKYVLCLLMSLKIEQLFDFCKFA